MNDFFLLTYVVFLFTSLTEETKQEKSPSSVRDPFPPGRNHWLYHYPMTMEGWEPFIPTVDVLTSGFLVYPESHSVIMISGLRTTVDTPHQTSRFPEKI